MPPPNQHPDSRNKQPSVHWTIPGLSTFALQTLLPQLPVPTLDETLDRYLRSCVPLLTSTELAHTTALVAAFRAGVGEQLQAALEARAAACSAERGYPHVHWLEEWWDRYAYLSDRTPLPVRYNIFGTLFNGDGTPDTPARLLRAAQLLRGAGLFYLELRAERISPDALDTRGQIPLCMYQFDRLFGSSRVPGEAEDVIVGAPHPVSHVAVLSHGRAWSLRIIDGGAGGCPERVASVGEIASALALIEGSAAAMGVEPHPLSLLSTLPRGEWATHRRAVLLSGAANAESLAAVESALLVLSLCRDAPADMSALCKATHEGGEGGCNVWYDKPLTLIVFANGKAGAHMEHAHFDAPVTSRAFAFMARTIEDEARAPPAATAASPAQVAAAAVAAVAAAAARVVLLPFDHAALPTVRAATAPARAAFAALSANNVLVPVAFTGVGGRALRAAKLSPDSVVQLALQLAQWRDQGALVATYETATTRRFLHGRTETIRSCSSQALAFVHAVDALGPKGVGSATQGALKVARLALGAALKEHLEWLAACVNGRGVDRHLMGLRIAAAETGLPAPELFTDAGYTRTTNFELSSSNMSKPGIAHPTRDFSGFGAPSASSYGVCYDVRDTSILMVVSSDRSSTGRDAARFGRAIQQALADICALLLSGAAGGASPRSRM